MYHLYKTNKVTYAFLLVFSLLFWELILYPASVAEDLALFGAQGSQYARVDEAYITGETAVVQEAGLPEIISSYTNYISVSHIFSGRTFRGRNAFGRFLWAFYVLLLLLGGCAVLSKNGFFGSDTNQNLDLLLSFIHDQDGKKKIH